MGATQSLDGGPGGTFPFPMSDSNTATDGRRAADALGAVVVRIMEEVDEIVEEALRNAEISSRRVPLAGARASAAVLAEIESALRTASLSPGMRILLLSTLGAPSLPPRVPSLLSSPRPAYSSHTRRTASLSLSLSTPPSSAGLFNTRPQRRYSLALASAPGYNAPTPALDYPTPPPTPSLAAAGLGVTHKLICELVDDAILAVAAMPLAQLRVAGVGEQEDMLKAADRVAERILDVVFGLGRR